MFHPDQKQLWCWSRATPIPTVPWGRHHRLCSFQSRPLSPSHSHYRYHSGFDNKGTHRDSLTLYAIGLKGPLQMAEGSSPWQLGRTPFRRQDQSLESGRLLFWSWKPSLLLRTTLRPALGEPHLSSSVSTAWGPGLRGTDSAVKKKRSRFLMILFKPGLGRVFYIGPGANIFSFAGYTGSVAAPLLCGRSPRAATGNVYQINMAASQ